MKRKSLTPWIVMLVVPIPALFLTAMLQVVTRGINAGTVGVLINIVSLLIGIVAVVGLIGFPLWIVMIILAYSHNEKLKQQ